VIGDMSVTGEATVGVTRESVFGATGNSVGGNKGNGGSVGIGTAFGPIIYLNVGINELLAAHLTQQRSSVVSKLSKWTYGMGIGLVGYGVSSLVGSGEGSCVGLNYASTYKSKFLYLKNITMTIHSLFGTYHECWSGCRLLCRSSCGHCGWLENQRA
jgi:hypothetical protein